jgi:hypothetical protein
MVATSVFQKYWPWCSNAIWSLATQKLIDIHFAAVENHLWSFAIFYKRGDNGFQNRLV